MSTGFCIFVLHARARYESCLNWLHGWRVQLQCVSFTLHLKHMSFVTSVVNTCSRVVAAILLPLQLSYRVIKAKIGLGWTSWERTGQQLVSNCDVPRSSLCEFALSLDIFKMMVSHLHLGCLLPQIVCEFAAAHLCRAHLWFSCMPWKVCIIFFRLIFNADFGATLVLRASRRHQRWCKKSGIVQSFIYFHLFTNTAGSKCCQEDG